MHTMAVTVKKETDASGNMKYTIVRHNDSGNYHFTTRNNSDGLYELLCKYTYDSDIKDWTDDGLLKVIGVKK